MTSPTFGLSLSIHCIVHSFPKHGEEKRQVRIKSFYGSVFFTRLCIFIAPIHMYSISTYIPPFISLFTAGPPFPQHTHSALFYLFFGQILPPTSHSSLGFYHSTPPFTSLFLPWSLRDPLYSLNSFSQSVHLSPSLLFSVFLPLLHRCCFCQTNVTGPCGCERKEEGTRRRTILRR